MTKREKEFKRECDALADKHGGVHSYVKYPDYYGKGYWLMAVYNDGTYRKTKNTEI